MHPELERLQSYVNQVLDAYEGGQVGYDEARALIAEAQVVDGAGWTWGIDAESGQFFRWNSAGGSEYATAEQFVDPSTPAAQAPADAWPVAAPQGPQGVDPLTADNRGWPGDGYVPGAAAGIAAGMGTQSPFARSAAGDPLAGADEPAAKGAKPKKGARVPKAPKPARSPKMKRGLLSWQNIGIGALVLLLVVGLLGSKLHKSAGSGSTTSLPVTTTSVQPATTTTMPVTTTTQPVTTTTRPVTTTTRPVTTTTRPLVSAPGVVTGVYAVRGYNSATVHWSPASRGPVSRYVVTTSPGGAHCVTAGLSCVVYGLRGQTSYRFLVQAQNSAGSGPVSAPSAPVLVLNYPTTTTTVPAGPGPKPTAPTGVTATSGNRLATISWKAVAVPGGAPVSKYVVTAIPGSMHCVAAAPTTSCTVGNLTNGTSYSFVVVAFNKAGHSPASAPSAPVVPATVPGAPLSLVAQVSPGTTTVTLSWSAPSDDGGDAVTSYTVSSVPAGLTCTATRTTSCQIANLVPGTSYSFSVTATNLVGTGAASAASVPVVATVVPAAPQSVKAVRGAAGVVTVSWTAPASNGGAPLTGYTVSSTPTSKGCATTATSCTISGLASGGSYSFSVAAKNAVGAGPAAKSAPVLMAVPPSPPRDATASGTVSAVVKWAAPASNGGAPVLSYLVVSTPGSKSCQVSALSCTISGLAPKTTYAFTVYAYNAAGRSGGTITNKITTSGVPGAVPSMNWGPYGTNWADVWAPVPSNGGAPITGYSIVAKTLVPFKTTQPVGESCSATTSRVTCHLTNVKSFTGLVILARNVWGLGPSPSSELTFHPTA